MSKVAQKATAAMTITANVDNDATQQTKKKSKSKKNKSKITSTTCDNDNNATDNSNTNASDAVNEREIQAVSEELLRRLQINGSAIDGAAHQIPTVNGKATAPAKALSSANKSTLHAKHHNINNNEISYKSDSVPSKCAGDETLCNGVPHETGAGAVEPKSPEATTMTPKPTLESNEHDAVTATSSNVTKSPSLSNSESPKTDAETPPPPPPSTANAIQITYKEYENELQMPDIMRVIQRELSEPYSIYTYRYFIHNWPKLCFLAMDGEHCVGAIVCKLDIHRQVVKRGYIAMLAVEQSYRKLKVGTTLVQKAIEVCSCSFKFNQSIFFFHS